MDTLAYIFIFVVTTAFAILVIYLRRLLSSWLSKVMPKPVVFKYTPSPEIQDLIDIDSIEDDDERNRRHDANPIVIRTKQRLAEEKAMPIEHKVRLMKLKTRKDLFEGSGMLTVTIIGLIIGVFFVHKLIIVLVPAVLLKLAHWYWMELTTNEIKIIEDTFLTTKLN